ncbi:MAG: SET domain-containing protein [Pontiellaceae bacterium]|nr:SET domain-containing protein [Pontiellaceae bacterium]MBN2785163.1 SET domain-containing protein [Pontiellaceae bacterium]
MPNMHKLKVRKSRIHGKGVYAVERIPAGEKIGTYHGTVTEEDSTYVLWVTDESGREYGIHGETDLKFLNHSGSPNAEFDGEDLYALVDIRPGDEITFHYGEDFAEWLRQEMDSE